MQSAAFVAGGKLSLIFAGKIIRRYFRGPIPLVLF
jgi:hypothetical protein